MNFIVFRRRMQFLSSATAIVSFCNLPDIMCCDSEMTAMKRRSRRSLEFFEWCLRTFSITKVNRSCATHFSPFLELKSKFLFYSFFLLKKMSFQSATRVGFIDICLQLSTRIYSSIGIAVSSRCLSHFMQTSLTH